MNNSDFGGYVSYTLGGYKCHPFGTAFVTNEISRASSKLDIPASLSLKPGKIGFRRTVLNASTSKIFIYTVFVGLSEPEVNRLGSFLAIGIAAPFDLDCSKASIGQTLHSLLTDLKERVSDGVRFTSVPSIDVVNAFLRDNSFILESLYNSLAGSNREPQQGEESGLILLSEEQLPLNAVFNCVCDKTAPLGEVFLFGVAEKADVQNARHDFRIMLWPFRQEIADARPANGFAPSQKRLPLKEVAIQPSIVSIADLQRIRNIDQVVQASVREELSRFDGLEAALSFWKLVGIAATSALFVFLILSIVVSHHWYSTTRLEVELLKGRLLGLQEGAGGPTPAAPVPVQAGDSNINPGDAYVPEALDVIQGRRVELTVNMDSLNIREKFCSEYPFELKRFSKEIAERNPNAIKDVALNTYKRGQDILLPTTCKN